jgi:hypothetical protein
MVIHTTATASVADRQIFERLEAIANNYSLAEATDNPIVSVVASATSEQTFIHWAHIPRASFSKEVRKRPLCGDVQRSAVAK